MDINVRDDTLSVRDQEISLSMGTVISGYGVVVFCNIHKRVPVNRSKPMESFILCDLQQVLFLPLNDGQRKEISGLPLHLHTFLATRVGQPVY